MEQRKRAGRLAGVAIVAVVVVLIAIWLAHRFSVPPDTPVNAVASSGTAPAPASAAVAASDPFAGLSCGARQYQGSLALAVTLTQPVDRKGDLGRHLQVIDGGAAKTAGQASDETAAQAASAATHAVEAGDVTASGKPVQGNWVVGDNPRVIYFPYILPQRRYTVRLGAGLPAGDGSSLREPAHCQLVTDAMPPAFYFASRGVVLPAGQNGGLPVATVNVPEVDVQFLRVAPEHVSAFFDLLAGNRARSGGDADDDAESGGYVDSVSLKGAVGAWDLDRLKSIAESVYQGRFLTDDKPNRRHVTFLPVENIKELQDAGIYVAVMSEPGRFRTEYQTTYFYVSDIGLHARRYEGRIEAFSVSLRSGEPIAGDTVELLDGGGRTLAKATADAQGHVRFDGDYQRASVLRAMRGKEMTVLSLADPALDLSEFDVGGLPAVNNSIFVYAGRDLYRPGETLQVSVLPRDADGRPLAASPLTATLKRPDGRVVQSALWRPDPSVQGYVRHAIDLPPMRRPAHGCWSCGSILRCVMPMRPGLSIWRNSFPNA